MRKSLFAFKLKYVPLHDTHIKKLQCMKRCQLLKQNYIPQAQKQADPALTNPKEEQASPAPHNPKEETASPAFPHPPAMTMMNTIPLQT